VFLSLNSFLTTTNISYYTLPLFWLGNHFTSPRGDLLISRGLTNTLPTRDLIEQQAGTGIGKNGADVNDVKKLKQRLAAHENGFQAMIPFYAAVVSVC
jgi:hypothetical protein